MPTPRPAWREVSLGFLPPSEPSSDFQNLAGEVYGQEDQGAAIRLQEYQTMSEDLATQLRASQSLQTVLTEGDLTDSMLATAEAALDLDSALAAAAVLDTSMVNAVSLVDKAASLAGLAPTPAISALPGQPTLPSAPTVTPPAPAPTPAPTGGGGAIINPPLGLPPLCQEPYIINLILQAYQVGFAIDPQIQQCVPFVLKGNGGFPVNPGPPG